MKLIICMFITLLLVITASAQNDVGIINEGGEGDDIDRPTCEALENLPSGNCGRGDCHTLCTDLHGSGAWGECSGATECQCHFHC
ncbi:hypothetical protein HanXRQr2_Chr01g0041651 [Helianthus annuus]|uniref:Uncharacterized protein n=1 Tax=Helianthus annuus TaxID=4232 RepID=A0A251VTG9_HELAN|nr:hypothetical protein HanXRQr2_Chr01g0041651 [Helianthus annuus]